LETLALAPPSQVAGSASSAVFACHQRSATTASALSPTFTTCLTPGMPCTLAASKLVSMPPNTGGSLIAAHTMPGTLRPRPQTCAPVTLGGVSSRLTGLPAIFQLFGSLSATSFGGSILAAASATLPNVVLWPDGKCVITLFEALHSAAGTFHSLAA